MVVTPSKPMSPHAIDSFYRLFARLCCLSHPHHTCHSQSAQRGECDLVKHTTGLPAHQWKSLLPELDLSPVTDPSAPLEHLVESVRCLKRFLPIGCELFGPNNLKVDGPCPVDGGGYAEIWVCKKNNGQTVIIKSYRRHSSSNQLQTFLVSTTCLAVRQTLFTKDPLQRFYKEALVCSHLNGTKDGNFVPFLGIYSSPIHPFALVFEFMEHLNLGEYLRSNQETRRVEVVSFRSHTI